MVNLIWAEWYKLRKSVAIRILIFITGICAVVMALFAHLIAEGKMAESMGNLGFMFSDMNVISILGAVIAGVYICGDFDNKTIHHMIAGGKSRGTVVAGKAVIIACGLVLILLPYVIVTAAALMSGLAFDMQAAGLGFLNLLSAMPGTFSAAEAGKLAALMLTLIIVYIAQLSITLPLALMLRKPVLVIVIYYAFSILCGQLAGLGGLDTWLNLTPYGTDHVLLGADSGYAEMLQSIGISVVFVLAMLLLSYLVFRRAELK
ncbi:ABC transporter permease [Paenibacillus sp. 1P07SE]|uniref:ABC transporter permease n=1 Tax=Paenibacillus sp. 1P07SE TaxID=3132209 RepID=UPI0039A64458